MTQTQAALTAISPIDGRYRSELPDTHFFSEYTLIYNRVKVEVEYLLFLADQQLIPGFSSSQQTAVRQLSVDFSLAQAEEVKAIEATIHHDVKAVEYWLRKQLSTMGLSQERFVNLALTSEDTNAVAYSLLLQDAVKVHILPTLHQLLYVLVQLAEPHAKQPMLARTHGQAAVPTTLGKEVMNFAMRLLPEIQLLDQHTFAAKVTGAVGNFNAQVLLWPQTDWVRFSQAFLERLGLKSQFFTTQILPAENYVAFFQILQRINTVLLDLNQDFWRYISDGYLTQQPQNGQVGSSTMPHKVNPIDFENSEGNLGVANALLTHFSAKLPVSRLQRDLSDSTVKRHVGTALATSLLAYRSLLQGLGKVRPNQALLQADLLAHPEVLAEAFQLTLRFHGLTDGYEQLQKLTQGKVVTIDILRAFLDQVELPIVVKQTLKNLTPETYLGLAPDLTTHAVQTISNYLQGKS